MTIPDAALVDRFRTDLDRLVASDAALGVAVSGGPDSVALLLLAAAARPGKVEAATVDHMLRPESRAEAEQVAALCDKLGVAHDILPVDWITKPQSNLQAAAREQRYSLLGRWAREQGLAAVATGHHADDQAETVLMRMARGSGVAGLGGIRPVRSLREGVDLVRPLLGWSRAELEGVVAMAGAAAIDDPTNREQRFDRTAARGLLRSVEWLDPTRLAASASHCRDADSTLAWVAAREWNARVDRRDHGILLDVEGLPKELKRRLLILAMAHFEVQEPRGPDLMNAIDRVDAGRTTTLAGIKLEGGPKWRLVPAPPHAPKSRR